MKTDTNLSKHALNFEQLVTNIRESFSSLPDVRTGANKQYSVSPALPYIDIVILF
jgi:hypothetical protein